MLSPLPHCTLAHLTICSCFLSRWQVGCSGEINSKHLVNWRFTTADARIKAIAKPNKQSNTLEMLGFEAQPNLPELATRD